MQKNFFVKSHGLGNDYLIFDSDDLSFNLNEKAIKIICDVHFGLGSDGILLKTRSSKADFGLRIFNPDASEAEKSGNGLRIFCKYLFDYAHATERNFTVETLGGIVKASIDEHINGKASIITIEMGKASFNPAELPSKIVKDECLDVSIEVGDKTYIVNCVSVGNPHCIVIFDHLDKVELLKYGPLIENHKLFPNRINVQFVRVISGHEAEAIIWERGAGYTMASGSSACAIASVLHKKGLCGKNVTIKMPGGNLSVGIDDQWNITLKGPAVQVAEGYLSHELIDLLLG
jgi:diaminopimelate epimerase